MNYRTSENPFTDTGRPPSEWESERLNNRSFIIHQPARGTEGGRREGGGWYEMLCRRTESDIQYESLNI